MIFRNLRVCLPLLFLTIFFQLVPVLETVDSKTVFIKNTTRAAKKRDFIIFSQAFPELFVDVQTSDLFEDSITFLSLIPLYSAKKINADYQKEKNQPEFELKEFIEDYFAFPNNPNQSEIPSGQEITEHINLLWDKLLLRDSGKLSSKIPLPEEYIVPGGRFDNIYYWDSYFTILGLEQSQKYELSEKMISNFAYLIDRFGFIPNGNRSFYLDRSQPPFFGLMLEKVSQRKPELLQTYLGQLEREYQFWMSGSGRRAVRLKDGEILNRYWSSSKRPRSEGYREDLETANSLKKADQTQKARLYQNIRAACESGWDFSSRWFKDQKNLKTTQTTDLIPIDLNSLLYKVELLLSEAYQERKSRRKAKYFQKQAEKRKRAIQKYLWNQQEKFYFDYNFRKKRPESQKTLASSFPLFFEISTQEQAEQVISTLEKEFLKPGGLVTTLLQTGEQWDYPNGWAPLEWVGIKAADNYQLSNFSCEVANRWSKLNEKVFQDTGKIVEKYNVVDLELRSGGGEYPAQDGFGWTNGVYLQIKEFIKKNC